MVQYKDSSKRARFTQYWKLACREPTSSGIKQLRQNLNDAFFHFKSSANRTRLIELVARSERRLLSYEACSANELKSFCLQRRLQIGEEKGNVRLVQLLEAADDQRTFEGFLDLPPELRNQIYSMHFEDFEDLERPTPPPVTLANRQLRRESLILFYKTCRFSILSQYEYDRQDREVWNPNTWELGAAAAVFARAPKECLDNLHHLVVTLKISEPIFRWGARYVRYPDPPWYMQWSVDLGSEKDDKVKVEKGNGRYDGRLYAKLSQTRKKHVETFEERMTELFKTIGSRAEGRRLRREDLTLFKRVFQ